MYTSFFVTVTVLLVQQILIVLLMFFQILHLTNGSS